MLTPAPCQPTPMATARGQRVSLPEHAGWILLPASYQPHDSTGAAWIDPKGGGLVFLARDAPTMLQDSTEGCRVHLAGQEVHLLARVAFEPGIAYITRAEWQRAPASWLLILGWARDSSAQAEQVAAIYSLEP